MSVICYNNIPGFTYDGVAPYPFIPQIGDTWRERDSNNNVVQEWYWNGTYWLTTQDTILSNGSVIPPNFSLIYIKNFCVACLNYSATQDNDSNNYYSYDLHIPSYTTYSDYINYDSPILASLTNPDLLAHQYKVYNTSLNSFFSLNNNGNNILQVRQTMTGNSLSFSLYTFVVARYAR